MRVEINLLNRISAIAVVSAFSQNIPLYNSEIQKYTHCVHPTEGRCANVTNAGLDAVDADRAFDERREMRTAKSCGPDTPTLVSSLRKATFAGDGGKQARSPGRARRKPLKPLRGECRVIFRCDRGDYAGEGIFFCPTRLRAHWAPGIPCALSSEGKEFSGKPRTQRAARSRSHVLPSLRAKRSNPAFFCER